MVAGVQEAVAGGKALKDAGYQFDAAHTSALQRAQVKQLNAHGQLNAAFLCKALEALWTGHFSSEQ